MMITHVWSWMWWFNGCTLLFRFNTVALAITVWNFDLSLMEFAGLIQILLKSSMSHLALIPLSKRKLCLKELLL